MLSLVCTFGYFLPPVLVAAKMISNFDLGKKSEVSESDLKKVFLSLIFCR